MPSGSRKDRNPLLQPSKEEFNDIGMKKATIIEPDVEKGLNNNDAEKEPTQTDYILESHGEKQANGWIKGNKARELIGRNSYSAFIFTFTIMSVIGGDLIVLTCPASVDVGWQYANIVIMIVFIIDIGLNLLAFRKGYAFSVFFILDFLATAFIIPSFMSLFGGPDIETGTFVLARFGRVAKSASRAGKLIKFIKMARACIFSFHKKERQIDDEDNLDGVSKSGDLLHSRTIRNVVMGVLLMFFFPIIFDNVSSSTDTPTDQDFIAKFMDSSLYKFNRTPTNFPSSDIFQTFIQQYYGDTLLSVKIKGEYYIRNQDQEKKLRNSETQESNYGSSSINVSVRRKVVVQSITNIAQAFYLLILLMLGNVFFLKDADKLFVKPVTNMILSLRKLEKNMGSDSTDAVLLASEENETNAIAEQWRRMLESVATQHSRALQLSRVATGIARQIVFMNLEEASRILSSCTEKTELHSQFEFIIENLMRFKPFLPNTLFVKEGSVDTVASLVAAASQSQPSARKGNYSATFDGTVEVMDLSANEMQLPNDEELVNYKKLFELMCEIRTASMLMVEFVPAEFLTRAINIEKLSELSEEFQQQVSDVVTDSFGVVLNYGGHIVTATWNTHSRCLDHSFQSCTCALRLLNALTGLGDKYSAKTAIRIAIVSGEFVSGNTGIKSNRTPMIAGPNVDKCYRLLGMAHSHDIDVIISQATFENTSGHFVHIPVDCIQMNGELETIFELLPPNTQIMSDDFKEAFFHFCKGEFQSAKAILYNYIQQSISKFGADEQSKFFANANYDPVLRSALQQAGRLALMCATGQKNAHSMPQPYYRKFGWKKFMNEGDMNANLELVGDDKLLRKILIEIVFGTKDRIHGLGLKRVPTYLNAAETINKIEQTVMDSAYMAEQADEEDISVTQEHLNLLMGSDPQDSFRDSDGRLWRKSTDLLGAGGFGSVYLGISDIGMLVAIKVVDLTANGQAQGQGTQQGGWTDNGFGSTAWPENPGPLEREGSFSNDLVSPAEQIRNVLNEIRVLSRLHHDHIVAYLGTCVVKHNLLIVMEYVACGSLGSVINKFGKLTAASVAKYTRDILRGLKYLHDNNIVHRDIKPSNVLLDQNGTCKLADFGTAGNLTVVEAGQLTVAGTVPYMAPEAFKEAGKAADIWSLGITVLELLTGGNHAWDKLDVDEVTEFQMMYHLTMGDATPYIPPTLPVHARQFVEQCCQRTANDRPTAEDLLRHPFLC